jgi:hypothetical protein
MFGRKTLGYLGTPFAVSADGEPLAKTGGVTLDWTTFAAASGSDTTLYDNFVVPAGVQVCKTGQVICRITASGKFGPYDPAAADGRQTLARGDCFVVNRAVRSDDPRSDHPEAIYGGRVWPSRIVQSGTGTHTLAAGPTLAELLAAFPQIHPVNETA